MNFRHGILRSLIAALAISWAACAAAADDTIYFVQHSFYADRGKHIATNYHVGTLIPINTRARITDLDDRNNNNELLDFSHTEAKIIKISFPDLDNIEIKIENVKKHTHKNMEEIKNRMLGENKVDLTKFSKETQENIQHGQIALGMTKEEVLLAYGYPPAHVTPSTDLNQWTYWKNRFNRVVISFQNNKVSGIRD